MKMRIKIGTPEYFSFRHTVSSHGWSDLLPFNLSDDGLRLNYVFDGADLAIREKNGAIMIEGEGDVLDKKSITATVKKMLRLDHDLNEFYELTTAVEAYKWMRISGAGRLLRAATVYEDLIKTLCTTNCSWSLTKKMVSNLVDNLGEATPSGSKAFPTAASMAAEGEEFYRNEIKAGYRSPYFVEIAESVAVGNVDPEKWLDVQRPTDELKKEIKSIKGVGDYAAEHMLKLLGRYDGLALDSWIRGEFYKKHNKEKPCADSRIHRHYKKFGSWKGLVVWCDMTERWF
jgi:N-glycosylase/DNA lyase